MLANVSEYDDRILDQWYMARCKLDFYSVGRAARCVQLYQPFYKASLGQSMETYTLVCNILDCKCTLGDFSR